MTKKQKWWIPELPAPIILDILSRLPVKTLFCCRRVCKEWLSIISDPHFVNLHLSRSPISLLLKPVYRNGISRQLRLIDLQNPLVNGRCYHQDSQLKLKSGISFHEAFSNAFGANSCNGLIVFRIHQMCFICNPILGEFIYIFLPDDGPSLLGFVPRTDQYKLVQFYLNLSSKVVLARIYPLGERSWRELGPVPYPLKNQSFNALVNGAIHWVVHDEASPELIRSFDFDKEKLVVVPEPHQLGLRKNETGDYLRVGVLEDCLVLCDYSSPVQVDLWVMREYGVKESWGREFVIAKPVRRSDFNYYEPVTILKTGEIVMFFNKKALVLYDPKDQDRVGFKPLKIQGIGSEFLAIAHVPSFVSLKDVANGEKIETTLKRRMNLAKKAERG